MRSFLLFVVCVAIVRAQCPYARPGAHMPHDHLHFQKPAKTHPQEYPVPDYQAVQQDILTTMTTPQAFWPPDDSPTGPNYGPFFIRLAWHCTGSYRHSDGRGGCDGGNMRMEPVRSWDDNTNLDKALRLLEPIKLKYGPGLSWGDLIVLAGSTAIQNFGGPFLGFCGGRIDFRDGANNFPLGPTNVQDKIAPCPLQGDCKLPLGTDTVGLIYVNPQGYMANNIPEASYPHIRDVFGRMDMNDTETVALIAGGHSFGRTHGACPLGAGPSPKEDPYNPWPGVCPNGGVYTSGIDGPWTTQPTKWDSEFLDNLLDFEYDLDVGPGGAGQWSPKNGVPIIMLTTDIALTYDDSYLGILKDFQSNFSYFDEQFGAAWYKLVSRDMGPAERCVGNLVAPPQPFQHDITPTVATQSQIDEATDLIKSALYNGTSSYSDPVNGQNYQGALFVQLAWQCATTFRQTDYRGGCNGAGIRFPPQSEWEVNIGMQNVLQQIGLIRSQMSEPLSWADTIVLAGNVALEDAGAPTIEFCGGRGDVTDGSISDNLEPRDYITDPIHSVEDTIAVMGLTPEEYVALEGRLRSPAYMEGRGYHGSWTTNPSILNNSYYTLLIQNDWNGPGATSGEPSTYDEYTDDSTYMVGFDLAVKFDPALRAVAQAYSSDNDLFLHNFVESWTKMMNIDRFDGPTGNVCDKRV
mmetsp:Transcript_1606/g.2108  ORF Transcript_1606/g.2108 Transcript_1606/m.2108 type:complete len:689 (-) Transcript_1606:33-2099(-)|eukprot:CAMPEP_0201487624 /NCGR_PEP_ID=MMETSP0151_2-20130828/14145_1 /ASSEMBLY_ACC=CAM_ASM_000257 /TAXON_ID=200890 /ORGANISM="Paramoeba atlantica, Strain 621/1 / CCAP 1560/9" /LENGTH=688 /DNA_ID=CAMNT_0047872715 /DNA_START=20 /DNA_END=2086 /DNA_ORIENTATION=+